MAVLVLRLAGPLQAWGTGIKLNDHPTDTMPSKSGVVGMVAAAMGRKRNEDFSDLAGLRFGVRADRPGTIARDYHTAHIWETDKKGRPVAGKGTYTGKRDYIQDACFTAGLEGDSHLLEQCKEALDRPVYPPYLGRRSCIPDAGVVIGIFDGSLEDVFSALPLQSIVPFCDGREKQSEGTCHLRVCVESTVEADRMRQDNPLSFDFHNRQYAHRREKEFYVTVPK